MGISEPTLCHCQQPPASPLKKETTPSSSSTLFAPIKGKMKVLKKIKKRIGLASRSNSASNGGTNNLPPLLFHNVHGEHIRISRDGTVARRAESFCKGIAFSARPVKINEKICIKFVEISNNWSGVIRFGFTYNDPSTLRCALPKYACPDLTNKPGYWAKALPERFANQNTILFYYVTSAGDVHFGINGEEKGIFFSGVETRGPLWALIDVYGNSTAIEFADIRHQLNNSRRNISWENNQSANQSNQNLDDIERISTGMQSVNISEGSEMNLPILRHQVPHHSYTPLPLHRTRGRNVRFTNMNRSVASRVDSEFCQGYVFTARPVQLGESIVVQVLSTEPMFQGCLGLGLTSCDPSTLQSGDLPDDSNFLLDRPEYWVISRDFARTLNVGDEISFCISHTGEVQISKNGATPTIVIHVDQTLKLWAFFDIYGSTRKIRVLHCPAQQQRYIERHRIITPNSESMNSINQQSELRRNNSAAAAAAVAMQSSNQRLCCVTTPADVQVQPGLNGGAVLSVILPPSHASLLSPAGSATSLPPPTTSSSQSVSKPSTNTMLSTCSSAYIEPIGDDATPTSSQTWVELNNAATFGNVVATGTECTICYEKSIDAVLYMCGHMCMCYECALQQWRGKGGGHCPLCRAIIRDVIRTYKS